MIRDYVEHHIICDGCGVNGSLESRPMWDSEADPYTEYHVLEGQESLYETKRKLLQRAKKYGWKRIKGKDYCPNCVRNRK
jgi:hypothetical protein